MSEVLSILQENWRIVAIGLCVLSYFGWDKAKALLGKIKMPSIKKTVKSVTSEDLKAIETADIAAIARLRNRAIEYKNEALLKEIKNVAAQFFDLHCDLNRIDNKSI